MIHLRANPKNASVMLIIIINKLRLTRILESLPLRSCKKRRRPKLKSLKLREKLLRKKLRESQLRLKLLKNKPTRIGSGRFKRLELRLIRQEMMQRLKPRNLEMLLKRDK